MKEKICIITGANSGIGKETAIKLAQLGIKVVMICRSAEKGLAAQQEIIAKSNNKNVELHIADLSSQIEIRQLAHELKIKYPEIHILINNAGAINDTFSLTVDQIETTFATNHLAYFLLTDLLIDNLKSAGHARVINLASEVQRMGKINFDDINYIKNYSSMTVYSQSKLANIMFTYEMARRIAGANITVNCMHPGVVRTGFGTNMQGFWKYAFALFRPFMRTTEKAARTSVWLATSDEVAGITGKYFFDRKEIHSNLLSYSVDAQKKLWEISENMTMQKG